MTPYPFDTIDINNRTVALSDIVSATALPNDDFEQALFTFTRQWLEGTDAFVQETSGSTGAPKPIAIRRAQMAASARMTQAALNLQAGQTALVCLSPAYIAGKVMLVRCFETGMRIIARTPSAKPFAGTDAFIHFSALVPYQVHAMVHSADAGRLNTVGTIIIGGAALDDDSERLLQAYTCACYTTYGMTETISHVALRAINGRDASAYYTPLHGVSLSLDERQCLVIRAPHLPEAVVTNDLVEIRGDGSFRWLGRYDNVINSGGVKVIPETLEADVVKALKDEGIALPFFIASVPDPQLGEKIVMVVQGHGADDQKILALLRDALPAYKAPREIRVATSFVMTKNGKIDRKSTLATSAAAGNH